MAESLAASRVDTREVLFSITPRTPFALRGRPPARICAEEPNANHLDTGCNTETWHNGTHTDEYDAPASDEEVEYMLEPSAVLGRSPIILQCQYHTFALSFRAVQRDVCIGAISVSMV